MDKWYLRCQIDRKWLWIMSVGVLCVIHQYFSDIVFIVAFVLIICSIDFCLRKKIEFYENINSMEGQNHMNRFYYLGAKIFKSVNLTKYAVVCLTVNDLLHIHTMNNYETKNQVFGEISDIAIEQLKRDELFCWESKGCFLFIMQKEAIWQRMRQIVDLIIERNGWSDAGSRYSINCGIYILQAKDHSMSLAVDRAKVACNQAQKYQRNWISSYDDTMLYQENRGHWIEEQMIDALARGDFRLHYQPKIRLKDERVVGAEVLVRWIDQDGNIMYPDEFISILENDGFILHMDLYIFKQVCCQLRTWMDAGYAVVPLSVNISSIHLHQAEFYQQFLEIMRCYKIDGSYIELELKENVFGSENPLIPFIMEKLKEAGIKVCIDGFGSGLISFRYLNNLLVSGIKVDKTFFQEAMHSERGKFLIKQMKELADGLGMNLSVQGVETIEQVSFLQSINCYCVQGFYYAESMALNSFEQYLNYKKQD